MVRKAVPSETEKKVLIKSRRRCCICFWLEGIDKVQKGQIAHLDGNNENMADSNLAFCAYRTTTSTTERRVCRKDLSKRR